MNASPASGAGQDKPGKKRWLWPLLIVSLGLNLLFVGLIAGRIMMVRSEDAKRHSVFTGAIEELMQELPAAKRDKARALLDGYLAGVKPRRQQIREARKAARSAVTADTYDEAATSEALNRLRQLRTDEHEALHVMIMGLLKELSQAERKQLVKNIRAGFRQGRYSRRRDKLEGEEPKARP